MRSIVRAVLVPLLFLTFVAAGCSDDSSGGTASDPKSSSSGGVGGGKEISVVILPSSNPPAQIGTDDQATGYVMDMIKAAAGVLDYKVKFVPLDFAAGVTAVQSGRYDVEAFMFGNADRYASFDVSVYYSQNNSIVTLKDAGLDISENSDLCGHKLAITTGAAYTDALDAVQADCKAAGNPLDIVPLADAPSGLLALKSGQVDMHLIQTDFAEAEAEKNPDVTVQPLKFYPQYAGLGFGKNNSELATQFTDAFNQMIADGTYGKIMSQYKVDAFEIDKAAVNPDPTQ